MTTMAQIEMLTKMCEERGLSTLPIEQERLNGTLTNARVQHLFQVLKGKPKLPKVIPTQSDTVQATEYTTKKSNQPAAEGGYQVGDTIYKVKNGKSGYNYAMELVGQLANGGPRWEIAKGMVFKLTEADRMTAAQVKAFGDLYRHCIYCGKELTRPESIDRGCGPSCAAKHGIA